MKQRHVIARTADIPEGGRKVVEIAGREIGVFNVSGAYHALSNRCPHLGGPMCEGLVTGIALSSAPNDYRIERKGEFLRCPWHGWEFEIASGQSWCDPATLRARQFEVEVEHGSDLVKGPFVAETFDVRVEDDYLVVEI